MAHPPLLPSARFLATLGILAFGPPLATPAVGQVAWSGQIRPRSEARRSSGPDDETQVFTSMRTRVAASIATQGGVRGFVQIQDVRLFGEEANSLGDFSANGFDLHQGWILLGVEEGGTSVKVGRQEVAWGGERLVGSVGWAQQGRAFDGARARIHPGGKLRVDFLATQLGESAAATQDTDASFLALYGVFDAGASRVFDLYAMNLREGGGADRTREWTAGGRHEGSAGALSYRLEGSIQRGTRRGADVSAFMAGARVGRSGSAGSVTLWYDYLSGTAPEDGRIGAFSTLFATNHKYYGLADLFTDIPSHTSGRGLQDAAVKVAKPLGAWTLSTDVHHFRVAEAGGLAGGHLADEADVTLSRKLPSGLLLSTGASYVRAGHALGPVRGIHRNVTFLYLMLDLAF